MNWRGPDWLLGRRFHCDFTVLSIGDDPARTATLLLHHDGQARAKISFDELMATIEREFVTEK